MMSKSKQRIDSIRKGVVPDGYKKTKAGIIPTDWEIHPLSQHLSESRVPGNNGSVAKKLTVKLWNKGVFEKREVHSGSESTKYYKRKKGQFIYSKLDFLNCAFGIIPEELDGYESTIDLPCFDILGVNDYYLLSYITQPEFYTHYGMLADGGRKARRVDPEEMLSFPLIFPPLPEQQKIAEILSTQDKLIELKEKLLEQKQEQKKYLVKKIMFASDEHNAVLADIIDLISIRSCASQNCYVSTENMISNYGGIIFSEEGQIVEGIAFRKDDILVGNIRPYLKKVWRASIDGVCSADVLVFRAKKAIPLYLYYLVANDTFCEYVMNGVKGTKMPRGDKKHILQMPLFIPPLPEQQTIAEVLSTADKEIDLLKSEIEQEKQKKKALMQLLLTGIVRVKV